jgi:predicted glycosyltransferase
MSLPKVLIHCQYVYGLGHLIRALQLAKGLLSDYDVHFLSGGEAVDGISIDYKINFVQLDALYKEEDKNYLSSVDENLTTVECLTNRAKVIEELIYQIRPSVIITEHFPFGFLFEKEVIRLIEQAKTINPAVKIVCSVRDVIATEKGTENDRRTINILNKYYDLLLVHGDEDLIPLERSFSFLNQLKIRRLSTGYVVDSALEKNKKRKKTIVVSVAGGRIGRELKDAVVRSFIKIKNKIDHDLLVFDGAFNSENNHGNSEKRISYLKFDRAVFLKELSRSDISISLGGYNTTAESIFAGNKVLIYKRKFFGDNFEQEIRISTLENLGLITSMDSEQLKTEKLAALLLEVSNKKVQNGINVNFNGVSATVREINNLMDCNG